MQREFIRKLSGPRPYESIVTSPHRAEIDERLFERKEPVTKVYHWLTTELSVSDISYVTLTRYKNAELADGRDGDKDIRRTEVRRDLRYLGRIIKLGKNTLDHGLAVRPSEAMRAIELRSYLLATFPDATKAREAQATVILNEMMKFVREVITEEQRLQIVALIKARMGIEGDE